MTISSLTRHFFGREEELESLLSVSNRSGAQFVVVYGRRRVGKTTLLLKWGELSQLPTIYWVAVRGTPVNLRQEFTQAVWRTLAPDTAPPTFDSWEALFENLIALVRDQRLLVILDEFPWMGEADSSFPSRLQNLWDHRIKGTNLILVLAGSHIGMMSRLFEYQSPLYGRFTAQLLVKPLPFQTLKDFLPRYDLERRISTYAVVGGIPTYLELFEDDKTIAANIKTQVMAPTGIFRNEPFFLLSDQVREPRNYISIIRAIGRGRHTLDEIATDTGLPKHQVSAYLDRLQDLRMVERRLPVTIAPAKRSRSHQGRYHLSDHYHRFHFRFIDPNLDLLEQARVEQVWEKIGEQFRAFIGATAFEEICREWVWQQADQGKLPFKPDNVGSHWGRGIQIDVAAINWTEQWLLLGECKWGTDRISAQLVKEFEEKTHRFVAKEFNAWNVHKIFFARGGFTEAAQTEATRAGIELVGLKELEEL
ncbi:ATP-binding protein [Anaerolineae bacterium CFX7]|nr:ATP-binding protein [Anaerolineae bacterium CFX7]